MPTSAYNPGLFREQETPLVIGKNWFLDQEIPAVGFVRIQDSSQVWEEQVDETRIITMEGLTTCLNPGLGWSITSGAWIFLKKAGVLGRPRASADYNYSEKDKTNRRVVGSWIQITNMGSITSTAADQ